MRKNLLLAAFASFSLVSSHAYSQNDSSVAQSSLKVRDALKNKKFDENTDITDAKMKADAGSLSRYSIKFSLSYYGPTLDDFSKSSQPDPDNSVGVHDTSLGGSISTRYRLTSSSTIGFGTGLNAIKPLHGVDRVDVNNPYVSYDVVNKLDGWQLRNSWGASYVTVPAYTKVGEVAGANWDASAVYKIGTTRFSTGLDSSVAYYFFNRPYNPGSKGVKGDGNAQRSNLALFPTLKYALTDKLVLNTSLNISFWNPRSEDSEFVLRNKTVSQRLGLGWAAQRDIYIFPYLNFYPTNVAIDTTTVNLSTVFSVL